MCLVVVVIVGRHKNSKVQCGVCTGVRSRGMANVCWCCCFCFYSLGHLSGPNFIVVAFAAAVVIKFVTLRLCWLRAKDWHKLLQVRLVLVVGWNEGGDTTDISWLAAHICRQCQPTAANVIEIGFKFSATANFLAHLRPNDAPGRQSAWTRLHVPCDVAGTDR